MTDTQNTFDYDRAFSRNLGFITAEEREIIKTKRIAIAGMGGVGGSHLITLLRMGFQKFHLSDFDEFEIHNFNRQYGATMRTLDQKKLDVMAERAREINPNVELKLFPEGVDAKNVDEFLKDVDIYIDGVDLFATKARHIIFRKCEALKIPASTVAPVGMGAALVNFIPGKMSFDDYFGFTEDDQFENAIRLVVGVTPKLAHAKYLVDRRYLDLKKKVTSSTPMGVMMSSSVIATETLKILLKRGPVSHAPTAILYDGYLNERFKVTTHFGKHNFLFKMKVRALKNVFSKSLT